MSDTGRENDPFAAFESDRTVIKPGTGRGAQPGAPGAPARPGTGPRRACRAAHPAWMPAAARKRRWRSTP